MEFESWEVANSLLIVVNVLHVIEVSGFVFLSILNESWDVVSSCVVLCGLFCIIDISSLD